MIAQTRKQTSTEAQIEHARNPETRLVVTRWGVDCGGRIGGRGRVHTVRLRVSISGGLLMKVIECDGIQANLEEEGNTSTEMYALEAILWGPLHVLA